MATRNHGAVGFEVVAHVYYNYTSEREGFRGRIAMAFGAR